MKLLGPTLLILGAILNILALFMLVPLALSIAYNSDNQLAFFSSATITSLVGIVFLLIGKKSRLDFMQPRQVFLITSAAWTGVSLFSALPFIMIDHPLTLADAVFEAVSGVTSTGSSVMVGLDQLPKDILLWRSLLNWIGGVGIIGMAIAVLPFLRVGGMRLFKTESSDWSDKAMPRARSLMAMIIYCYIGLSILCCLAYWLAGMDFFNAINHSMATVSTGGFSTSDSSFAQFDSLILHWIAIIFMLAGAFPFVLFVRMLINHRFIVLEDTQVRGLLLIVVIMTLLLTIQLIITEQMSPFQALTMAGFNLVSIVTTTGFASGDYQLWGPIAFVVFYFAMFVGGCSGSTSGGIKVFRLQIFAGLVKEQIITAIHPRAIISRRYNGRLISSEIIASSISYMCLMAACLVVIAVILAFTGLDMVTSISGAATAVMNVGPGMGDIIGPAGNFSSLSDTAKWALSAGMLLGRLEFLTIIVLFTPAFWRA
ncbi:TrkH family potassium uptake protein [Cellvibrio sp. KY-YJ-3]|uniref:TrkH family potassium uptake protein n=1 Tax=Cellvibrio sp. KY-YJ-3 TaxID=454662 RepID=UPI0012479FA1|nr:TrkH family potassium uptake protein [Cellvibrio sp. KY-YJ-3]QEY13163.1 TrkH family potassium uptake protein [Cellvibrio sp. KY-YJ-3]